MMVALRMLLGLSRFGQVQRLSLWCSWIKGWFKVQKYYLPHLTVCACLLYLPQPAWICAAAVSYSHINIPNQAARRYLLHIISVPLVFFLLDSRIKCFIVFPTPDISTSLWRFTLSLFFCFLLLLSGGLQTLSHTHTEPGDGWDNELWMRPPLLSAHTPGPSFQFPGPHPLFGSPPMSFNEIPHGFVAFSLPLCFSLAILLSDLRNSLCIVPFDWGYKESGPSNCLSQYVKTQVFIASV